MRTSVTMRPARSRRRAIRTVFVGVFSLGALALAGGQQSAAEPDAETAAFEEELFASEPDAETAAFEDELFSAEPAAQTVPALTESVDAARIEYLVGGTVVVRADAYAPGELDELLLSAGVSGKLFAKVSVPSYGALYIAYEAAHTLYQSYSGEGEPRPGADPYEPSYSLSELHYSFDIAKALFLRIGNQLIAWGPSRIWSPVDFINQEKADAFAALDLRVGKPGLRLHLPLRGANAFLFGDFSGVVRLTEDGWLSGDPLETLSLGGRFDFTAGPFEFGLTGYGGKSSQLRLGVDISGRLLGATVYAEVAGAPPYSDYDAQLQASVGFSRALGELKRWTVSAEGFFNTAGQDLTGYTAVTILSLPEAERRPLYQGKIYVYGAITADKLLSPSLSTTLSAIWSLTDMSFSVKLAESLSIPGLVPVVVALSWAGGGADKEFTRFGGNNALSLAATTRIEF